MTVHNLETHKAAKDGTSAAFVILDELIKKHQGQSSYVISTLWVTLTLAYRECIEQKAIKTQDIHKNLENSFQILKSEIISMPQLGGLKQ